ECGLEGHRIEQPEHTTEGVVAWNSVLQPKKLPQQGFLRQAKVRHVGATLGSAQHCRQGNDQDIQQLVPRILGARVRQRSESPLESLHPTLLVLWESSSESILRRRAIPAQNSNAIPLPFRGG